MFFRHRSRRVDWLWFQQDIDAQQLMQVVSLVVLRCQLHWEGLVVEEVELHQSIILYAWL